MIEHDLLAWPALHVRLALLDDRVGPSLAAAQNRRGLVVYVAARPVDRAAARARPHARRLPRRRARRAGRPPRDPRGRRLLRLRAGRQRGAAAATAAHAPPSSSAACRAHAAPGAAAGARAPAHRRAAARRPALAACAGARDRRSPRSRRLGASLHWMSMLEPAEPGRAAGRSLARRAAARCAAALLAGRAGCRGAGGVAGVRRRCVAAARADAARAAASPTSCCCPTGWGELAGGISRGHLRPARRARALPRPRRLGAHRDPARRHRARGARRAAGVLAAARAARLPGRRAARCWSCSTSCRSSRSTSPHEFLRGAVFTLLMVAFLRLEKLRRRDAPAAGALRRVAIVWRSSPRRCSTATRRGSTTRPGRSDAASEVDLVHAGTTTTAR